MCKRITRAVVSIRRNEWGEWVVRAYVGDDRYPAADYYTDDRSDAQQTARAMVQQQEPSNV